MLSSISSVEHSFTLGSIADEDREVVSFFEVSISAYYTDEMDILHTISLLISLIICLGLTILGISKKIKFRFVTILLLSITFRLILIGLFVDLVHYDTMSYRTVGSATMIGSNIYPEGADKFHPYLPFLLYIEALSFLASR